MHISTYLGAGENVYASEKNLYIALTNYSRKPELLRPEGTVMPVVINPSTFVYKFALENGQVDYQCEGEVPGKILNELGTTAYYQGLKVALFDVTNVEKPVEKFKVIIGDRGTESELLKNHKALLFSKDKNLLAFPVNGLTCL
jgi:hypothetical protein